MNITFEEIRKQFWFIVSRTLLGSLILSILAGLVYLVISLGPVGVGCLFLSILAFVLGYIIWD